MGTWRGGYIYRGSLALVALNEAILAARPPDQRVSWHQRGEAPCGTVAAAKAHWRRGEPLDEWCRAAQNRDQAGRRALARKKIRAAG